MWGLQWFTNDFSAQGVFPQYYKEAGSERVAVPAATVPAETKLLAQQFELAKPGESYTSPKVGAWASPGPRRGAVMVRLRLVRFANANRRKAESHDHRQDRPQGAH